VSANPYDNRQVAEWARQNIVHPVMVRTMFSSQLGKIFIHLLLFSVPGFFFLLGIVALALGAKDPPTRYGPFVISFLLIFPCCLIALLGAYVRRSFAKSLDRDNVNGSFGMKLPWNKLYYVNHVTKHMRTGRVSRTVKDNQLELVFEGGKLIIPPLIHDHGAMWTLINSIPCEVRDDGKPRATPPEQMTPEQKLMAFLNSQK
jgi:hypothetical protein